MLQLVTMGGLGLWQPADAVLPALEVMRDNDEKKGVADALCAQGLIIGMQSPDSQSRNYYFV